MKPIIYSMVLISLLIFAEGAAADPNFVYLGNVQDANGLYVHSYKITNPNDARAVPVYDIEVEYEYTYGWIEIESPDGWVAIAEGPMKGWVTDSAPCEVDGELFGFKVKAATPTVFLSPIIFTGETHTQIAEGTTPLPSGRRIPSVTQWGLIIMTLGLLTVGAVVIIRKRQVAG